MSKATKQIPIRLYVEIDSRACGGCGTDDKSYTARVVVRNDDCPSHEQFPIATLIVVRDEPSEGDALRLAVSRLGGLLTGTK